MKVEIFHNAMGRMTTYVNGMSALAAEDCEQRLVDSQVLELRDPGDSVAAQFGPMYSLKSIDFGVPVEHPLMMEEVTQIEATFVNPLDGHDMQLVVPCVKEVSGGEVTMVNGRTDTIGPDELYQLFDDAAEGI